MDKEIKIMLNNVYNTHYSKIYNSRPITHHLEDTNYYYTTHAESNVICLIPVLPLTGTLI